MSDSNEHRQSAKSSRSVPGSRRTTKIADSAQSRRATAGGTSQLPESPKTGDVGFWETIDRNDLHDSSSRLSLLGRSAHTAVKEETSKASLHRSQSLSLATISPPRGGRTYDEGVEEIKPELFPEGFQKNYHKSASPRQSKTWERVVHPSRAAARTPISRENLQKIERKPVGLQTFSAEEAIPEPSSPPSYTRTAGPKLTAFPKPPKYRGSLVTRSRTKDSANRASTGKKSQRGSLPTHRTVPHIATSLDNPRLLDGFALLSATNADLPDAAVHANLTDNDLADVEEDDLPYFTRLEKLNVSMNHLNLDPMRKLPALAELIMTGNDIADVSLPIDEHGSVDGFMRLEILDLSHNQLCLEAIAALSEMPRLRVLDISFNSLKKLPSPAVMANFITLEELYANDNYLSEPKNPSHSREPGEFHEEHLLTSLSCMPSLRVLNLARNYISTVPELVAIGWMNDTGEQTHTLPPFCALKKIDLSHNLLRNEEHVVNLIAHTPWLQDVNLTGNPLTETSKRKKRSDSTDKESTSAQNEEKDAEAEETDETLTLSTRNLLEVLRQETVYTSQTLTALVPPHSINEQEHSLSSMHGSQHQKGRSVRLTLANPRDNVEKSKSHSKRHESLRNFSPMRTKSHALERGQQSPLRAEETHGGGGRRTQEKGDTVEYIHQMSTISSVPSKSVEESDSFIEATSNLREAVDLESKVGKEQEEYFNSCIPFSILQEAAAGVEEPKRSNRAELHGAIVSLRDILSKPKP